MEIGVWLPSMEFVASPEELVAFARTVESAGARYLASSDHVLTTRLPDDHASATMMSRGYHEPFVTYAVLAARTGLDFTTSVLVLPQRPAALVAKQLAELRWWFGDRFRLGVGSGWNEVEFRALGMSFAERGPVLTEQAGVIGSLWAGGPVDYHGRHHMLAGVGLDPAPGTLSPPLWFGGHGPAVIARTVRYGRGWIPLHGPDDERTRTDLGLLREGLTRDGLDPATFGLEGRVEITPTMSTSDVAKRTEQWRALGASHLTLTFEGVGFIDLSQATTAVTAAIAAISAAE